MPMPPPPQVEEIVVVAADGPRRQRERRERRDRALGRSAPAAAAAALRPPARGRAAASPARPRESFSRAFSISSANTRPSCAAAVSPRGEALARPSGAPSSSTPTISCLGAQRHGHPGAALASRSISATCSGPELPRPAQPGVEVAGRERQRMRVMREPVEQEAARRYRRSSSQRYSSPGASEQHDRLRRRPVPAALQRDLHALPETTSARRTESANSAISGPTPRRRVVRRRVHGSPGRRARARGTPHRLRLVADRDHRRQQRRPPRRQDTTPPAPRLPTITLAYRNGGGPIVPIVEHPVRVTWPRRRPRQRRPGRHTTAIFSPPPTMRRRMPRLVAPSAIRVPISTVRCRTEYETHAVDAERSPSTPPRPAKNVVMNDATRSSVIVRRTMSASSRRRGLAVRDRRRERACLAAAHERRRRTRSSASRSSSSRSRVTAARKIDFGDGGLAQAIVLHVADDADHLEATARPDPLNLPCAPIGSFPGQ